MSSMNEVYAEADARGFGRRYITMGGHRCTVIKGRFPDGEIHSLHLRFDAGGRVISGLIDGRAMTGKRKMDQVRRWFSATSCDHAKRCCRVHESHSSPHSGCVLR